MSRGDAVEARPPVIVAAAVVVEDGRVLLTQRMPKGHLPGKWEFPGGKVEPGEDPVAAVVREVREETTVELAVDDILDVTFHRYPGVDGKPGKDVLLLFYVCRRVAGDVEHVEVADHAWVPAAEVGGWDLPPADHAVVAKIARRWGAAAP